MNVRAPVPFAPRALAAARRRRAVGPNRAQAGLERLGGVSANDRGGDHHGEAGRADPHRRADADEHESQADEDADGRR